VLVSLPGMNRDNQEYTDTVIAELRPREMWDLIAASDCQYLLVSDAPHTNPAIKSQFAPALSLLAFDGFRHLALEWPQTSLQPVIDAYNQAPPDRENEDKALQQLFGDMAVRVPPRVAFSEADQIRFCHLDTAMIVAGKRYGMQITALNPDMPPLENYMQGETPETQTRMTAAHAHHYLHGRYPAILSRSEEQRLDGYINQHVRYNLSLDRQRAEKFRAITGARRGSIMFGPAHFRGAGQQGIDDFLPQDKTAYVMMGDSFTVQRLMEGNCPVPLRTPDFAVLTDLGVAYATPAALRHGLLP